MDVLDRPRGRFEERREQMVEQQIAGRGVRDPRVLAAMRSVPREAFVPERMREFAYDDTPLPIGQGQTISQPYMVAVMAEALLLRPGDRILEVGAGSGYAAAVFGRLAAEVYAIERHEDLARAARQRLEKLGLDNVHVVHGDGTLGLGEQAPFDAIIVSAGGPKVPDTLKQQLALGGRLLIPVGDTVREQTLMRITRQPDGSFREEDLGGVRFVPLVGEEGWEPERGESQAPAPRVGPFRGPAPRHLPELVAASCEPFQGVDDVDLEPLLDRIGDARVVLLGEATHGTSEFYRFRARLTRALVERSGFTGVAVEADWPDAAQVDHYVRHLDRPLAAWRAFSRFPEWMWRNTDVLDLVEWMRAHNEALDPERRVGFFGLDLYSLYTSIDSVVRYLDDVDPAAARVARERYGCLSGWEGDPATYGRAALTGAYEDCEEEVVRALGDLLDKRLEYARRDGERFLDAAQNARLVKNAERYYRVMYYGNQQSWNLRDSHMFETLQTLLAQPGGEARIVVWAHNSHVGDARFTEMGSHGEHNIGQLCRRAFGNGAYIVGFGTDSGTVAAADHWDGPMRVKDVRPSHPESYERVCHNASLPGFLLPLRTPHRPEVRQRLVEPRLERAIGVIYRPESELRSHYFQAVLPRQFDEYVWFDRTEAVTPLETRHAEGMPDTFPFGV